MRLWIVGCLCSVLLPSVSAASCDPAPSVYVSCSGADEIAMAFTPWDQPDYFLPPHQMDRNRWRIEQEEPAPLQKFHPFVWQLGNGPRISYRYRRHEVTITQDCWRLTFRGFSKINLACQSKF